MAAFECVIIVDEVPTLTITGDMPLPARELAAKHLMALDGHSITDTVDIPDLTDQIQAKFVVMTWQYIIELYKPHFDGRGMLVLGDPTLEAYLGLITKTVPLQYQIYCPDDDSMLGSDDEADREPDPEIATEMTLGSQEAPLTTVTSPADLDPLTGDFAILQLSDRQIIPSSEPATKLTINLCG